MVKSDLCIFSSSVIAANSGRLVDQGLMCVQCGILGSAVLLYSSLTLLQCSILRPPLIIRPLDLVPKTNFLCFNGLYFKITYNIRPNFLGPMGGLKIEATVHCKIILTKKDKFAENDANL